MQGSYQGPNVCSGSEQAAGRSACLTLAAALVLFLAGTVSPPKAWAAEQEAAPAGTIETAEAIADGSAEEVALKGEGEEGAQEGGAEHTALFDVQNQQAY